VSSGLKPEAAEILSNATGKKIDYVNISDEEARGAMKEAGLDDWLINTISDLYNISVVTAATV
jgi:hypothetical protein